MKIKLGEKYFLNSDQLQFWITGLVVSESGKTYERRYTGYFSDFRGTVENFIDRNVKGSDSANIKALMQDIEALKAEVRSWPNFLEGGGAHD